MKIIEAMKQTKDLVRKREDLNAKIGEHCADLSIHTPPYKDQAATVKGWLQGCEDISREILRLRYAIQRTNIDTNVTIELGGKHVTKTIAEWIHRRRDLAQMDGKTWAQLSDRGLKDQVIRPSTEGGEPTEVKVRRYFSVEERDEKRELYASEPSMIDGRLEVVNAVTDLVLE